MPKPTDYDKTHLRNMAAIGTRIDRIFKKAYEEAAKIGVSIKTVLPEERIFNFDDYPQTKKQIERLMSVLKESMETTIVNGVRSAWTLSNNKNNALVSRIFGDNVGKLTKEQYRRYFSNNEDALNAFLQRQTQGLNLSDRVWRYTNAFKREIEFGLDLVIRTGENAASMSRSLRQYLQHPDKLFRRVQDKHGILRLSQAAKDFHPGQGVYRSSYKNARRLACTETNIAYRTSDHLRWQQMDFVVGIEIKLSNNHTLNGVPFMDICDTLAGKYPKDFKFTGWHPHCRCYAVTVLKTEEEMAEDTQRILDGQNPKKDSMNTVSDVPAVFKGWVEEHADRIENAQKLPYFIKDNKKRVEKILGIAQEPQKTPIEIAQERHESRTTEQTKTIQQAWNKRRIKTLDEAIQNGHLPEDCKETLKQMLSMNSFEHFRELNARIETLRKVANRHTERSEKTINDIKERWAKKQKRDANTRLMANNVLKVAQNWQEVDFSNLQNIIVNNNLGAMREEAKKVAQAIKVMRDEEKALSEIIPYVHNWHKQFSLAELKQVRVAVEIKLAKLESQGMSLATNSNLTGLKKKLEFEIDYVGNPGKFKAGAKQYPTWEVAQKAYEKQLVMVETRIEVIKLTDTYEMLLDFKTTSKDFKNFMAKAKDAIETGDVKKAEVWLNNAQWKKKALEAKRKMKSAKANFVQFGDDAYTQERKNNAVWCKSTAASTNKFKDKADEIYKNASEAEKQAAYRYTQGSGYINRPLRGYDKTWYKKDFKGVGNVSLNNENQYAIKDIEELTKIINKSTYDKDIWLQRGVNDDGLAGFLQLYSLDENGVNAMVGKTVTDTAFMSCGAAKGTGFSGNIINIYCPKGTKMLYIDGRSAYKTENEMLIQRGTHFRVAKVEKQGYKYIIDVEVVAQI